MVVETIDHEKKLKGKNTFFCIWAAESERRKTSTFEEKFFFECLKNFSITWLTRSLKIKEDGKTFPFLSSNFDKIFSI